MTSAAATQLIDLPPKVEIDPQVDSLLAVLDSDSLTRSAEVRAMVITDQDSYERVALQGRLIATGLDGLDEAQEIVSAPLWLPLKRIREAFKVVRDVMEGDKKHCATTCGAWEAKKKREDAERDRLARVESDRLAQEVKLNAAIRAEDAGLTPAAVEQILSSPVTMAPAAIMPSAPKAQGTSGRIYWKLYPLNPTGVGVEMAEEVAFRKLVIAAAENPLLMCFLQRNLSACDSEAKKGRLCQIPGYEALQDNRASFRKL